ncbi:MAG: hypothetical protein Q9210_003994 [Variospora velana]
MSVDSIVIPGGILAAWDGPAVAEENHAQGSRPETFDITEVARRRARTLSVTLAGPEIVSRNGPSRPGDVLASQSRTQGFPQRYPSSRHSQNIQPQEFQRACTINLGNLGRPEVEGRDTLAAPRTRLKRASSWLSPVSLKTKHSEPQLDGIPELKDAYVFQSLGNPQSSDENTLPATQHPSTFHGRNTPNATEATLFSLDRTASFPEKFGRSQSDASIAVENAVDLVKDTVTNVLCRSSLEEVYEKAKIRQLQLKRSNAAQTGFEYTIYLFLLAIVYFVIVGVPFWDGLVLTIYHVFDMKLVVPAGTAAFLGAGFLSSLMAISPTPLDNTAAVCERYGVSHTWSPIGSKIVAQFVGCYVAKQFPNVLLIDDDCLLPPNFPIITDRFTLSVKCIGYTIKSVGPNSSKGTLCQQAQDVEYKRSGIQRAFAGKIGSATFPHGAISIWDREILIKTFQAHPGFSVSEDWFFGHVARQLGCRIQMCTAVFVETETPDAIFFSGGGDRGGFGEMTIWKQRFFRWNFFFISGIYYDLSYMLWSWKLRWWEFGAKLFVFQEIYETLLYLLAPFVLPISFYVRPNFSGYLFAATLLLYMVNTVIFNYVHLRLRDESVSVRCLLYYFPYKMALTFVNIASCYHSIWKCAKNFAKRHPKVIEDENAVAVVLRLEEERFTVIALGTNLSSIVQEPLLEESALGDIEVVDFAIQGIPQLASVPENELPSESQAVSGSRTGRPAIPVV